MLTGWFICRNRISLTSAYLIPHRFRHPLQNIINIRSPTDGKGEGNMVRGNMWRREGNGGRKWRTRCCGTLFPWNPKVRTIIFERPSDERKSTPSSWNKVSSFLSKREVSRRGRKTREETREDTRERGPSRGTQFPALSIPFSAYPTSVLHTSAGRTSLSTSLRKEEIGFRLYSRNLKPPLLRLSLNAVQFSVSYSLPLH